MKKLLLSLALVAGLGLNACIVAPVVPPIGIAFTEINAPLDVDFDQTKITTRSGMSESMSILGLVALGDASAKAAADNGTLKQIHHADYEYFNVLGVYQRYRTVVYGE